VRFQSVAATSGPIFEDNHLLEMLAAELQRLGVFVSRPLSISLLVKPHFVSLRYFGHVSRIGLEINPYVVALCGRIYTASDQSADQGRDG